MLRTIICLLLLSTLAFAAPKPHAVALGRSTTVKWLIGPEESLPTDLKIRPLLVDGHMKDYVTGPQHDITEHLFVIRRVFRVNDSLPDEKVPSPQWLWQRSGWLLVDRSTGHTVSISLPEYDFYYSAIAWYRDYAAYCGMAEDGKRIVAIVAQIGRRQPVLKKTLGEPSAEDSPDSACNAPSWQRRPARVTFEPMNAPRFTYAIRGHAATAVAEEDSEEAAK